MSRDFVSLEQEVDGHLRRLAEARSAVEHALEGLAATIERKTRKRDRLEAQLGEHQARYEELQDLLRQLDEMAAGIRDDPGWLALQAGARQTTRTEHSRRGRIGIRPQIVAAMARHPAKYAWDSHDVCGALAEIGVSASPRNVARTLARMAADGELERAAYGFYRLPAEAA